MTDPAQLNRVIRSDKQTPTERSEAVTATIISHDGTKANVAIPSFDGSVNRVGPIPYVRSPSLAAGSTCLVLKAFDTDEWWVLAP